MVNYILTIGDECLRLRNFRISNFNRVALYWLIVFLIFIGPGCRRPETDMDVLAAESIVEPNVVVADYASRAAGVTGGFQAWAATEKFEFDGVVTFYKEDGSFYLTEQHFEVYPWLNSVRISAVEPQGKLVWELLRGPTSKGLSWHKGLGLPVELCKKQSFAESILDITTASVRFLDSRVVFSESAEPVKIKGLWYYPLERTVSGDSESNRYWSNAIFYQNRDNYFVDMIYFKDSADGDDALVVRGYDYRKIADKGAMRTRGREVLIPSRIEIFQSDIRCDLKQRLVKIDIYSLGDF